MDTFIIETQKKSKKTPVWKKIILAFFVCALLIVAYTLVHVFSPVVISEEKFLSVKDGSSLIQISQQAFDEGFTQSPQMLRAVMQLDKQSVKSGTYAFLPGTYSVFDIADKLHAADYGDIYVNLTFPEGLTNTDVLQVSQGSELEIDIQEFATLIADKEGYLFPDTYSFLPSDSAKEVVAVLEDTFQEKYIQAQEGATVLDKTQSEIITMASIIEKEAGNSSEEKQRVSGILWKRIREGQLLQVDAPFVYERGKGSADLTYADLREDSVFNTYTNLGLPPRPIGNPGYDSMYAAFHPIETPYYFYLHGKDGVIRYAKTYSGHLKNIRMYLR